MKKSIFVAIAFMAATSITSQLFAQDATSTPPVSKTMATDDWQQNTASKTSGYDLKKNVRCRVIETETGCSLAFDYDVKSPRDIATGQSSGKRQHGSVIIVKEFSVSSSNNAVAEVKSPKDAASGLATGKRQHKPVTFTKEVDKSSPELAESVMGSGEGAGKVNVQDISFTKSCGGKSTKLSVVEGECVISTDRCPNGQCSLTASWSWGASNSGSSSTGSAGSGRCSVDFLLEIEDGVCTAMAISEQGSPKKETKKQ